MKIVFRVDASVEIGTGHVMRCLTLANALREQGGECHFLCREHKGHLIEQIEEQGFQVYRLKYDPSVEIKTFVSTEDTALPYHAHWLGVPWQNDAEDCRSILETFAPDWLVVDHYALDTRWEGATCPVNTRLLAIDDLADREHLADVLLDQNLGRNMEDYTTLVPAQCHCLIGPEFALLRSEFAQWRDDSLTRRREQPRLKRLLITLGGVDKDNVTGQVLEALNGCSLPEHCGITVIMGATAPWLDDVKIKANALSWPTEVVVSVNDMARRMAEADIAIGAAGSTSWERCCLGLPTLMLVLAENQKAIAQALDKVGAAVCLGHFNSDVFNRQVVALQDPNTLQAMSDAAARQTSGEGGEAICRILLQENVSA
ncbi:UDP-2,4-diacetamido-2,4,6-trideoxy-beta-L-altropyranose hydrolase [Halomonas llamarensis]|uniref:UDP-2,4-diacetamido-2,4, 6-trideoxy-beta-L-altropyranose hydrolase n=1 Tax=Halomonas llamarensis TaxID=2945104 RepID=A0ABT0SUT4_9GAMM|nr:UDP-2,4-diacetamido-2,4,6-trideoxy-beta-L-altropyranose hydrolase [Halomonas llamarensis]MCL7931401.1 UDP-2,4-diacetamido-2,4,6-trideoxy-beta-L-altropyranose hydrolase [Halomonas llamarensis]